MGMRVKTNVVDDPKPNGDDPIIDEPANVADDPNVLDDDPGNQDDIELTNLKNQNAQLAATNNRLLEESKKHKRAKQKSEDEKLKIEGNKDVLISNMQSRIDDFEAKEDSEKVAGELSREAQKRGCPNWDLMYNAVSSDVQINPDTGVVDGVEAFFDACEADERLKKQFFADPEQVKTDNSIPTNPVNLYRTNPAAYLKKVRKDTPEKYNETVAKMQRDGLIG